MANYRTISVLVSVIMVAVTTAGILAAAFGHLHVAICIMLGLLLGVVVLTLSCTHHIFAKLQNANEEFREESRQTTELISVVRARLDEAISNSATEQTENRSLLKSQHEEIVGVQKKCVAFDNQLAVNQSALESLKKETKSAIRETERRLSQNAPKAVEVRRAHERVEAAERRILGSLETQLHRQGSTLTEQAELISGLRSQLKSVATAVAAESLVDKKPGDTTSDGEQLRDAVSKINRHVTMATRDGTRQVESIVQLLPRFLRTKLPMPSTGGFAIDAQALAHLIAIVEERRPRRILELGSGTSSVWLGYLCQSFGSKLVTFDHLEEYLSLTRSAIDRHHLNDHVESRLAPLERVTIDDSSYEWYAVDALKGLSDIDLLVIDGPPAATGPMARYPALPMIADLLSKDATIVLDDAHRDDEADVVQRWQEIQPEFVRVETGASRLAVLERGHFIDRPLS